MNRPLDIHQVISELKAEGQSFAIATVVRTVSVTAAKAGAKAVIDADGNIVDGWIGGGCAKGAVLKAAKQAVDSGEPCLVSLLPEELAKDVSEAEGVNIATNMCPSQGTMDIFVEPVLPPNELLVLGNSPVAISLEDISPRFGLACTLTSDFESLPKKARFIVVSTQGSGDLKALGAALDIASDYTAFVGSRKKVASLCDKLEQHGYSTEQLEKLKAPAGLNIGAITPDEIALSILAEIIEIRRCGQRGDPAEQKES
ncbi:MAG: XdhC family protein [Rhizobiaceae bacterium]|nr:XdhC family protein [Rhizobiaceae bacterium]